jgi:hypothetical protein
MAPEEEKAKKPSGPPVRPVRVSDSLWTRFGEVAGVRGRAPILIEFIRWYVHAVDAKTPRRPEGPDWVGPE